MNKKVGVINPVENGIYLNLEVDTDQRQSMIGDIDKWRNAIRVSVAESPVSGKANKELVRLFENVFPEAKGKIIIVKGQKSSSKKLFMPISQELVNERLCLKK